MAIPGFGESRTYDLIAWRSVVQNKFRFDPSKGVPKSELQAIEIHFVQRRNALERQLQSIPHQLHKINAAAVSQLQRIDQEMVEFEIGLAQAQADLNACI
jgi:DNA-binding helix-hairpin-helix protein with protein kinase domain